MRRSARTDLCGGRPAMIVPTATPKENRATLWLTRRRMLHARTVTAYGPETGSACIRAGFSPRGSNAGDNELTRC
jgi:hypothetical protein